MTADTFDRFMEGRFKLYDEFHNFVSPTNLPELIQALEVRDEIQVALNTLMHDEDPSYLEETLNEQQELIDMYLESIGDFDNKILASNIAYLTQKNEIRIGDLENLLHISAGYISRTAKEGSAKKMSVDIAWKIARIFEVDLRDLLETDMQKVKGNTALLSDFIDKLIRQTEEGALEWCFDGGVVSELDQRFISLGLISDEDDVCVYHPNHLNTGLKWLLYDDIVRCPAFSDAADLVIIPFKTDSIKQVHYDFLLLYDATGNAPDGSWQKMFYTADDPFGTLDDKAAILYEKIRATEFDAKVTPDVRDFIKSYLK